MILMFLIVMSETVSVMSAIKTEWCLRRYGLNIVSTLRIQVGVIFSVRLARPHYSSLLERLPLGDRNWRISAAKLGTIRRPTLMCKQAFDIYDLDSSIEKNNSNLIRYSLIVLIDVCIFKMIFGGVHFDCT